MKMILSVIDVIAASEGFSRPIREGEEVLKAGFVVGVGLRGTENSVVLHVQALKLRTSGVASKTPALLEIWLDQTKDFGCRVMKEELAECGCPAGKSEKGKHIIAVMLYLAR